MMFETKFAEVVQRHLRKGHLRSAGIQILIVAIVMLLSGMVLLGANLKEMRRSDAWVQRSNAVLLRLAEVNAQLIDIEMSVRGLALTKDPAFQRYQARAQADTRTVMHNLLRAVGNEPEQLARYDRLKALMLKRMALFLRLSRLGPNCAADVARAIVDPEVRADRFTAADILTAMRSYELRQLAARQKAAQIDAEQSYGLAIGIVATAFLLSALGLILTQGGGLLPRNN
jgi:CHASE3 domain sensor protein